MGYTVTETSFIDRIQGSLKHDVPTVASIARDEKATAEAVVIVGLAGLLYGVRFTVEAIRSSQDVTGLVAVVTIVLAYLGWFLFSILGYAIGSKLLPGERAGASVGGTFRTVGFATAPLILGVFFTLLPGLHSTVIALITVVWALVCVVAGIRSALSISTIRAIAVCLLSALFAVSVFVLTLPVILPLDVLDGIPFRVFGF